MSKVKKKKTIKSGKWTCDIVYSQQETEDLIAELKRRIRDYNSWMEVLEEKKSLEEQLPAVRIKIIKRIIDSYLVSRYRCTEKLKELGKPARKTKKKKE